jgi:hypothetical protein
VQPEWTADGFADGAAHRAAFQTTEQTAVISSDSLPDRATQHPTELVPHNATQQYAVLSAEQRPYDAAVRAALRATLVLSKHTAHGASELPAECPAVLDAVWTADLPANGNTFRSAHQCAICAAIRPANRGAHRSAIDATVRCPKHAAERTPIGATHERTKRAAHKRSLNPAVVGAEPAANLRPKLRSDFPAQFCALSAAVRCS